MTIAQATSASTATRSSTANTILNGIDVQQFTEAAAGIAADPSQGQVAFRARTSWQGRLCAHTEVENYDLAGQRIVRRHHLESHEPLELLGDNSAPNPQDLLLTALASCMTVGFVVGATAEGIRIDSLTIDTECALDLRGAFGLDPSVAPGAPCIKYTIRVQGNGTAEQFEQVHQRVIATSPNYYHLARPIAFESKLVTG